MGGIIMNKYFFISFKAINGTRTVGGGGLVVVCSCGFDRIEEHLLDYYNGRAINEANDICITSITVLDKQTASQLSNDFTDGALIIDDGDTYEEKNTEEDVKMWLARDMNNSIWLYVGDIEPKRKDGYWSCGDDDSIPLDDDFFPEVQWSDEEPTKVKLVIDK